MPKFGTQVPNNNKEETGYNRIPYGRDSSSFNKTDRDGSLRFYTVDEQTAIRTQYKLLDIYLAEFSHHLNHKQYNFDNGNQRFETNQHKIDRNIIKLMSSNGNEYFHFSLFIKEGRYGGLHITCPSTSIRLYLEHTNILAKSCEGALFCNKLLRQLFDTLHRYFSTEKHLNQKDLKQDIKVVIDCILDRFPNRNEANKEIVESLRLLREAAYNYKSFSSGGSTKTVMYLVKIDKLKQKNKLLKKDKIKNKNKIEKNNKLINELKAKAKKEKAKATAKKEKEKQKAKAKKEKAKAKAKKVTCKKSTCSKKNKK